MRNNGGPIDTNGFDVTVAANLLHSTVSGDSALDGGLTKAGTGTLTLSAANTFTGPTNAGAGTLTLANANALQNSTLNLNGGAVVFDGSVTANANAFTVGGLSGSGNLTLANNAATPAGVNLTAGGNNAGTIYPGVLSGGGSLTKAGTGNDQIAVGGQLTINGNLNVTVAGGFTLATGQTFNILVDAATLTTVNGTFANTVGGTLYRTAGGSPGCHFCHFLAEAVDLRAARAKVETIPIGLP